MPSLPAGSLSDVWEAGSVIAVVCGDIHLSHTKPFYRSPEPDWYEAQDRYLSILRDITENYSCPLIVCGDLFDRWAVNPELITFAMRSLPPTVFAIPGQHDLPNHDLDQMGRSGYGVLSECERIFDMSDGICVVPRDCEGVRLYPFPWGNRMKSIDYDLPDDLLNVAIAHQYVHNGDGTKHVEADDDDTVDFQRRNAKGFDAAFFGDNHIPFESGRFFNCGSLMTRHASDRHHDHGFFIIHDTGQIQRIIIPEDDIQCVNIDDVMKMVESGSDLGLDITQVGAALAALWADGLDFVSALNQFMKDNDVADDVVKRVTEAVSSARSRTSR